MKKYVKLILWNLLVFFGLLLLVNCVSWLILSYKNYWYKNNEATLPAMINKNYVKISEEWSQLKTSYQPFIGWRRYPFAGEFINVDQEGYRKTINSTEGRTIRFFGGSTMWGARLEDKNTIPSLFGKCSEEDFEIINHGESGFNSRQELAEMINIFLKKKRTDLVVFYDGVNDIDFLCDQNSSIPSHKRENQFKQKLLTQKASQNYFHSNDNILGLSQQLFYKIFLENTRSLIKNIRRYLFNVAHYPYSCHVDSARAEAVAGNLLDCWKNARVIAKENGSEFIAILQPNIYIGNANSDYLTLDRSGLQGENFKAVYKILQKKIAEENVDWMYDFSSVFADNQHPLYFDFCHLNNEGNEIVANNICKIIGGLTHVEANDSD